MKNTALSLVIANAGPLQASGNLSRADCMIIMGIRNLAPATGFSKRPMGFVLPCGPIADESVVYHRVAKAA